MKRLLGVAYAGVLMGVCACSPTAMQSSTNLSTSPQNMSSSVASRLMPRNYLVTNLDNIFGPSADAITSTMIAPVSNDFLLGGPCDNNDFDCPNNISEDTQAPMVPPTVTGREALVTRACDLIANIDSAIRYAAAMARGESLSADFTQPTDADTSAPSQQDLDAAYDLFYPGKAPDSSIISALLAVSQEAGLQAQSADVTPALDAWRFTLLTLCLAPDWQIP